MVILSQDCVLLVMGHGCQFLTHVLRTFSLEFLFVFPNRRWDVPFRSPEIPLGGARVLWTSRQDFLFAFSRQLLKAYDSTTGQLWLVLVAGVFALGGWMLHSYGQIDMPERFAARTTNGSQ